jgi:K+-sensing histidine kinase KdpD
VRNAVAYSDPGSTVVVEIVDEGTRLRLSVRDQGPGIPVGERETIFDPFVRGEAGSRRGRGSGLGLFITRRVVEAHGGTVWLDPGYPGADFQMVLPVDRREAPRFASRSSTISPSPRLSAPCAAGMGVPSVTNGRDAIAFSRPTTQMWS